MGMSTSLAQCVASTENSRTPDALTLHSYSSNSVAGGERTPAQLLSRCLGLCFDSKREATQVKADVLEVQMRPLHSQATDLQPEPSAQHCRLALKCIPDAQEKGLFLKN